MNSQATLSFCAAHDSDTDILGCLLSAQLKPGNLVLLEGELGAGKSALARSIIRSSLKCPELEIPSPTFLLVLPYQNQHISFLHADLYRLETPEEIEELGLFEDPAAIILVEWPQRAPNLFPLADLVIRIEILPENKGRQFTLSNFNNTTMYDRLADTPGFLTIT